MKNILMNTEMALLEDLGMMYQKPTSKNKERFGMYLCPICEAPFKTRTTSVNAGRVSKCRSCSTKLKSTTHGDAGTRLYHIWAKMKYRCSNSKDQAYKYYGAKRITVCKEWNESYAVFKEWCLENGYKEYLVLDKDIICERENIIPKIYGPKTCMWITSTENSNESNKRRENAKYIV